MAREPDPVRHDPVKTEDFKTEKEKAEAGKAGKGPESPSVQPERAVTIEELGIGASDPYPTGKVKETKETKE